MHKATKDQSIDNNDRFELPGEAMKASGLSLPKAIALTEFALADDTEFIDFVECRRVERNEVVVLTVQPEVPQHPVNDIRRTEEIVVAFDHDDRQQPSVTARRISFPRVTHTNVGLDTDPVELCLFDTSYSEQKLNWTAALFTRQLHRWLSKTARGELHDPDQPLEQLFIGSPHRLILPRSCFLCEEDDGTKPLVVRRVSEHGNQLVLIAEEPVGDRDKDRPPAFAMVSYTTCPQTHGVIRIQPLTLHELVEYLGEEGNQFLESIARDLRRFQDDGMVSLELPLVIVIRFPKTRTDRSEVEEVDVWAFGTGESVLGVGGSIGLWGDENEAACGGFILGRDKTRSGEGIQLSLMTPTSSLRQIDGARCNGIAADRNNYVAVGAGSLGSQVVEQLVRSGHGRWTIVDDDLLLPHNVARHFLSGHAIGHPKAQALSSELNLLYEDDPTRPIVANVLRDTNEKLNAALAEAEVLVDLSASVSVARHLSLDVQSPARRVSAFLSPSGQDSVLLVESEGRSQHLDLIEMDYYRALIRDNRLRGHLDVSVERDRYANACRDISVRLPHDAVVLHSALVSRGIRNIGENASALIWRTDESLGVATIEIPLGGYQRVSVGDWTVFVSNPLLAEIKTDRASQLPSETGGVLVGGFDMSRQTIYVVDQIPSPTDSVRRPTAYIRGCDGLEDAVASVQKNTAGQLSYVGEWHSHPSKAVKPSDDDEKLFDWLTGYRRMDGVPAVMAIAGSGRTAWFIGDITCEGELTHD